MQKLAAASLVILVTACSGAEVGDPDSTRERIKQIVPTLVGDSLASMEFTDDSQVLNDLLASSDSMSESFTFLSESLAGGSSADPSDTSDETNPQEVGDSTADFLVDTVFTEANYEGDGVYLLHGEDFCPNDPETGALDPECVSRFNAAEFRIKVLLAGNGLDVIFLVGPDRFQLVVIELRSNSLAAVVDLAELKKSVIFLASVYEFDVALPEVMEGVAAFSLIRNAPRDITFELAVRDEIVVEGTMPNGSGTLHFSTAAKDPLVSVRANGVDERLSIDLDLGVTRLIAPWSEMDSTSLASGTLDLAWMGLSASAVLEKDATSLVVSNIGFGDDTSTVKLDGQTLFAVDLNATSGRRFDLEITPLVGELPLFSFTPQLDLSLLYFLQPLADAGDFVESYLMDESYGVLFSDSASPTVQPVDADPLSGFPGGLKIVSGVLAISSTAAAAPVVATAGQCLIGDDPVTAGEHAILGQLAIVPCP